MSYLPSDLHIVDTGHSIEVEYETGSHLTYKGIKYNLIQFHFHEPSEHRVKSKHFDMEMHLVHKSNKGDLLVLASFIKEGQRNHFFDLIWSNLPEANQREIISHRKHLNIAKLFKSCGSAYYYSGSLNTPACTERVQRIVLKAPLEISKEQIQEFTKYYHANYRTTQR